VPGKWRKMQYVMRLDPSPSNQMYGRGGFYIHAGKGSAPGTASTGCIVTDKSTRQTIWSALNQSGPGTLAVTP